MYDYTYIPPRFSLSLAQDKIEQAVLLAGNGIAAQAARTGALVGQLHLGNSAAASSR